MKLLFGCLCRLSGESTELLYIVLWKIFFDLIESLAKKLLLYNDYNDIMIDL